MKSCRMLALPRCPSPSPSSAACSSAFPSPGSMRMLSACEISSRCESNRRIFPRSFRTSAGSGDEPPRNPKASPSCDRRCLQPRSCVTSSCWNASCASTLAALLAAEGGGTAEEGAVMGAKTGDGRSLPPDSTAAFSAGSQLAAPTAGPSSSSLRDVGLCSSGETSFSSTAGNETLPAVGVRWNEGTLPRNEGTLPRAGEARRVGEAAKRLRMEG
mmetsp:Transcript_25720/g.51537  ORF Transcript_25720/g.51537 Transcript_25720/m.51537 type:complete len:215 (-) Transcript_25720:195-839(-)